MTPSGPTSPGERWELDSDPDLEEAELAEIYVDRGLDRPLAAIVAERLMAADPLGSHVRDELNLALALLAALGVIDARLGGARAGRAALQVVLGGGLAMGLTALIGSW